MRELSEEQIYDSFIKQATLPDDTIIKEFNVVRDELVIDLTTDLLFSTIDLKLKGKDLNDNAFFNNYNEYEDYNIKIHLIYKMGYSLFYVFDDTENTYILTNSLRCSVIDYKSLKVENKDDINEDKLLNYLINDNRSKYLDKFESLSLDELNNQLSDCNIKSIKIN